ncbi:olfactory receptor 2G3-like [Gracilinanus agilis]|uniref:olfactory receptor 2G3-like n=1 Tax=Gracilinanus agilis TaxID=191870 RepID=UPI001CFD53F0|nr:olfactory receptor 2G3-like [Gracilinanus agilis]
MGHGNVSALAEFFLLGLSTRPALQPLLFAAVLASYLATVLGNVLLVSLILLDGRLHRPMYRLLAHLALLDVSYVSTTVPQALAHMLVPRPALPFGRCGAQLYVALSLGSTEAILLASMAVDRCLAVCRPLRYAAIMTPGLCGGLAGGAWALGFLLSVPNAAAALRLPYCAGRPPIDHFFCELPAVLRVACADTAPNRALVYAMGVPILLGPFGCILASYGLILATALRLPSARGRSKALSTCGAHLAVVGLFYGTVMAMYLRPRGPTPAGRHKLTAVFYIVVTPLLNPLIYSLRNKDVHRAARYAVARLKGMRAQVTDP